MYAEKMTKFISDEKKQVAWLNIYWTIIFLPFLQYYHVK